MDRSESSARVTRRVARAVARMVRSAARLACDPAGWSARRYREQDEMHFAAVRPDTWRDA